MRKYLSLAIVVSLAALVLLISVVYWEQSGTTNTVPPGTPDPVVIGMEPNQVNSLIIIADERGYFTAKSLNVTIRNYPSGAAAVEGMIRGESDIATATEFVLVSKALSQQPVGGFASIDRFQQIHLLGRRDHGIGNITDLRGKRIGVPLRTAGEFYLGRFLLLHDMELGDVRLVNVPPLQAADAISEGSVDAIVAWQPNVDTITSRLKGNALDWPAQGSQAAYCVVIGTDSWIAAHPDALERFLAALREAEEYAASQPDEARNIVRNRLSYEDTYISGIWPDHQFSLTLDQSLILAMEDEARWMIANNLTNTSVVPDFNRFIRADPLEKVHPDSVNIIR